MPSQGAPDPDGPEGQGPSEADRALAQMLEQWRTEDPQGFAEFMRRGGPEPYRQGSELRVRSPRSRPAANPRGYLGVELSHRSSAIRYSVGLAGLSEEGCSSSS